MFGDLHYNTKCLRDCCVKYSYMTTNWYFMYNQNTKGTPGASLIMLHSFLFIETYIMLQIRHISKLLKLVNFCLPISQPARNIPTVAGA